MKISIFTRKRRKKESGAGLDSDNKKQVPVEVGKLERELVLLLVLTVLKTVRGVLIMAYYRRSVNSNLHRKPYLNLYEAARYLGMSCATLARKVAALIIPAVRVRLSDGRIVYRFYLEDLHAAGFYGKGAC